MVLEPMAATTTTGNPSARASARADARAMRDGHLRGHRDLTRRKLAPAIYNLALGGFLPPEFTVVGFARRPMTNAEFHEHLREDGQFSRNQPVSESVWAAFAQGIEYEQGNLDDPEAYAALARHLERIDRDRARLATGSSTSPSSPRSCPRS